MQCNERYFTHTHTFKQSTVRKVLRTHLYAKHRVEWSAYAPGMSLRAGLGLLRKQRAAQTGGACSPGLLTLPVAAHKDQQGKTAI